MQSTSCRASAPANPNVPELLAPPPIAGGVSACSLLRPRGLSHAAVQAIPRPVFTSSLRDPIEPFPSLHRGDVQTR